MGHSQPRPRKSALELWKGGWGSGDWLQLSVVLFHPQSCPCAPAPAACPGTVPGPLGPHGSHAPAAVGQASSAACGPTTPQGPADTGAPMCLQPTRNAASATCGLAQVWWVVSPAGLPFLSISAPPHLGPFHLQHGTSPRARGTRGCPCLSQTPRAALLFPIQCLEAGHAGVPGPGVTGAAEGASL